MKFSKLFCTLLLFVYTLMTTFIEAACEPGVIAVASGNSFALTLQSDGSVWTWGLNSGGQLGNGSNVNSTVPVASNMVGAIAIDGGANHALALRNDGTVWAWGNGTSGQLGNGANANSNVPVQASGLTDIIAVRGGGNFSLALASDGSVWAWGDNSQGQLGDGTTTSSNVPIQSAILNVKAIAAGDQFALALKSDGTVWAWGQGTSGQIGNGANASVSTPTQTLVLTNIIAIAAADNTAAALDSSGVVWTWGSNSNGQLGAGATGGFTNTPAVSLMINAIAIEGGGLNFIAIRNDGTVWDWGGGTNGQLGNGTTADSNTPVQATGLADAIAVSAGGSGSTYALLSDATVWSWGLNNVGQLGNGTTTDSTVPIQVATLTGQGLFKSVAAGGLHSLGLDSGGLVWAWGDNASGQLGDGTNTNSLTPVLVSSLTDVKAIAAGEFHSLALRADGTVWAWGDNTDGQLGNGSNINSNVPVQVSGLTGVVAIAAGANHSLAILSNGTVWAWGRNLSGQLGNGSNASSNVPVSTLGIVNAIDISGGSDFSVALLADGTARAWGGNVFGQLGNGTNLNSNVPVTVSALSAAKSISAGQTHALALLDDGTIVAWGENTFGQLGDGSNTSSNTPVSVSTITTAKQVIGGYQDSLAVLSDGTMMAWGLNNLGQLGNGTNSNTNTPVPVSSLTGVKEGSATTHTLALVSDGAIWAWGGNSSGQLGNGTTTDSNVPVAVAAIDPVATATPPSETICSGQTTNIALTSDIPGTTFAWTVVQTNVTGASDGSGDTIAQTLTATTTIPGTAVYTVTPTAGGCEGAPITVTITVNPNPVATATPSSETICSGETTDIFLSSNVSGTTFSWTVMQTDVTGASDGSGNIIAQTLTATTALPGTAVYTITPDASGCPGSPITVTVTVNPVPVATATPSEQNICSGDTTNIALTSNVAGTTFSWTVIEIDVTGASADSGATIAQTLTATTNTPGAVIYTITPTAGGCEGEPITVTVTVDPIPVATASPSSSTICSGETTDIDLISNVAGTTFSWTVVQTNVTGASDGSGFSIEQTLVATTTSSGTAVYTVTPTASGCIGEPITVTVTVNPVPVATATPPAQTICSGETTSISLTSNVAGTTFTWTVIPINVSGASNGSGNSIAQTLTATANIPGTAIYTVTPSAAGCDGAPITVLVTVNPIPVATATPSSQTICSGETTDIALDSNVAGTTFSWTVVQTNVSGASSGSGNVISQTLIATTNAPGTAVYTITPTGAGCPGNPIVVTVTVNPIPVAIATPPSQTILNGQTTNIVLTSPVSGTTFSWTAIASGVTGASSGSGNLIAQTLVLTSFNPGSVTYTITPVAHGCEGNPITVVVTVNPGPPVPPTDFCGFEKKNKFLTQTELSNILVWTRSIDPNVVSYRIYQDDRLVAVVPATGPFRVVLHNRRHHRVYVYAITAVNAAGLESTPIIIRVPGDHHCENHIGLRG